MPVLRTVSAVPVLFVSLLLAQPAVCAPDPVQILEGATRSLAAVKAVTYDFTYAGWGSLAGNFSGKVRLKKGADGEPGAMWITMQVPEHHGGSDNPRELRIAMVGPRIRLLDERRKTVSHGTVNGGAGHLMSYAYYGVLFQFVQPKPFATELSDSLITWVGTDTVNGVPCDLVKAANNNFGGANVQWFIGRLDHLPHAQRWDVTTPGVDGGFRFSVDNLKLTGELPDADFEIETPTGYVEVDEDTRNVGLGRNAPDWTLRTRNHSAVRLSELRGQVVVLDFWASWCLPCWKLMPEFDSVAKTFEGRPVRFFAVNAWESPSADPAEYMDRKAIGYDLLLAGETIASDYKVGSLPAVFVIDGAGKIVYLNNPVLRSPAVVAGELRQAIEQALP